MYLVGRTIRILHWEFGPVNGKLMQYGGIVLFVIGLVLTFKNQKKSPK
jgi:hypothetical protein